MPLKTPTYAVPSGPMVMGAQLLSYAGPGAGQFPPAALAGTEVDGGEVPGVDTGGVGLLLVEVEQPVGGGELGHGGGRADGALPHGVAAAAVGPYVDAGDTADDAAAQQERGGVLVAVVVLDDEAVAPADQGVVGGGAAGAEDRDRADQTAVGGGVGAPAEDEDVHPVVRVVGDRHVLLVRAEEVRCRPRALVDRAGLGAGAPVVGLAPLDARDSVGVGREAVRGVVGDDGDAVPGHGEGVLDLLTGQPDGSRASRR